ncbi:MAG: alginate lyase family protein [Desulfuromonadaceae bacterium]|nr:alginate lyase family protein [Desulfuromonadaceae bacterium]
MIKPISHYIHIIKSTPPDRLAGKISKKITSKIHCTIKRIRDKKQTTYSSHLNNPALCSYFNITDNSTLKQAERVSQVKLLSDLYLDHRFDLLGSGWVQVKHGMECRGLEGYSYEMGSPYENDKHEKWLTGRINDSNLKESQRIWNLIDEHYIPIDWHVDFKSGYRWSEKTWYRDITFAHLPGVDVKLPWELARMQHLPQLAWAFMLAKDGVDGFDSPEKYAREFRNQILDFIATNPPRYGVNWNCTMDVGIRVANWLISYDLFRGFGATFDSEFESLLTRSAYEHGKHCIENLEYFPEFRSNHYLSNIAGLLFAANYLPETRETDLWIAFSLQELVSEMGHEFQSDGSNFEASTSYHRLSTEIMLYCSMFCLRLTPERCEKLKELDVSTLTVIPQLQKYSKQSYQLDTDEIFPVWYWERLERAVEFTMHITAPNGEIPQFGDNDSGRFLKLWPSIAVVTNASAIACVGYNSQADSENYPDEIILDHGHLMIIAGDLFGRDDFKGVLCETPESVLVHSLLTGKTIHSFRTGQIPLVGQSLQTWAYPDFGLYILRSQRIYLAIRCGSIGQQGIGGHAHNDQLSFELHVDGVPLIIDPGTYLYTPNPAKRNLFRSTEQHNTVFLPGVEQHHWKDGQRGIFCMKDKAAAVCETWDIEKGCVLFLGQLRGYGGRPVDHLREIRVDPNQGVIEICDTLRGSDTSGIVSFLTPKPVVTADGPSLQLGLVSLESSSEAFELRTSTYSSKYGMATPAVRICARFKNSHSARFSLH